MELEIGAFCSTSVAWSLSLLVLPALVLYWVEVNDVSPDLNHWAELLAKIPEPLLGSYDPLFQAWRLTGELEIRTQQSNSGLRRTE